MSTYKSVKIALSEFTNIDLTNIKEIDFAITGSQAGSGTFQLDNIRLQGSKKLTLNTDESLDKHQQLSVYPNAFSNHFVIAFDQTFSGEVSLKNMKGIECFHTSLDGVSKTVIDNENLEKGIYILSSIDGNSITSTKIIKY